MRTRRQFQPMLDSMPYRIAPSAFVAASVATAATESGTVVADTEGPSTTTVSPIILAPTTPPTTLLA